MQGQDIRDWYVFLVIMFMYVIAPMFFSFLRHYLELRRKAKQWDIYNESKRGGLS